MRQRRAISRADGERAHGSLDTRVVMGGRKSGAVMALSSRLGSPDRWRAAPGSWHRALGAQSGRRTEKSRDPLKNVLPSSAPRLARFLMGFRPAFVRARATIARLGEGVPRFCRLGLDMGDLAGRVRARGCCWGRTASADRSRSASGATPGPADAGSERDPASAGERAARLPPPRTLRFARIARDRRKLETRFVRRGARRCVPPCRRRQGSGRCVSAPRCLSVFLRRGGDGERV